MPANPWIAHRAEPRSARVRLFCFHHAGGAANVFRSWSDRLPRSIDVCPVQIPGHSTRGHEAPIRRVEPLAEAALHGLAGELTMPFAFFGHSFGALLAFQIARLLRRRGGPLPSRLFVAARRPPALPQETPLLHTLPDRELLDTLGRCYGGIPAVILREPDLVALLLPVIRADLEANETFPYRREAPLACPITAYGGSRDRMVSAGDLGAWRSETDGDFAIRTFDGDHFFVHSSDAFLADLGATLERSAGTPLVARSA